MSVLRPGGFGRRLLPCFRGSFPLYRFRSPIGRERPLHFGAMGTGQGPRFLLQLLAHQRPPDIPRLYAPFGHGSLAPPSYGAKPQAGTQGKRQRSCHHSLLFASNNLSHALTRPFALKTEYLFAL